MFASANSAESTLGEAYDDRRDVKKTRFARAPERLLRGSVI
jgi:hypothetical protein